MHGFLQDVLLSVPSFIVVLGIVVTVHELGHFLAAKWLGTAIDRFSIGFGRAIVSWRDKSGVEWRIAWMPLGGYVRFAGDENAASLPDEAELGDIRQRIVAEEGEAGLRRYFHFKPLWQRAIITAAGPVANFLLTIAIFSTVLMAMGDTILPPKVASVEPNTPAATAGFRSGDLITEANGRKIARFDDLKEMVATHGGLPMVFVVRRDGHDVVLNATPAWQVQNDPVAGPQRIGVLGVHPALDPKDLVRKRYSPPEAVATAVGRSVHVLQTTVYYLGRMITGQVTTDQLRGPIGIAAATGKVTQLATEGATSFGGLVAGVAYNLAQMVALISLSIGFINLLPIPVLDGGHLLFYAYEAVARRPLAAKVQAAGYRLGLALVLGLMLFATWNDLQRQRVFQFIGGLFS